MAAMMGWPPAVLYRSTLPELFYSFRGYQRSMGIDPDGESDAPMTRDRFEELCALYPDEVPDGKDGGQV